MNRSGWSDEFPLSETELEQLQQSFQVTYTSETFTCAHLTMALYVDHVQGAGELIVACTACRLQSKINVS